MKNYRNAQRKREFDWSLKLAKQMMMPPNKRNEQLIRKLQRKLGVINRMAFRLPNMSCGGLLASNIRDCIGEGI